MRTLCGLMAWGWAGRWGLTLLPHTPPCRPAAQGGHCPRGAKTGSGDPAAAAPAHPAAAQKSGAGRLHAGGQGRVGVGPGGVCWCLAAMVWHGVMHQQPSVVQCMIHFCRTVPAPAGQPEGHAAAAAPQRARAAHCVRHPQGLRGGGGQGGAPGGAAGPAGEPRGGRARRGFRWRGTCCCVAFVAAECDAKATQRCGPA